MAGEGAVALAADVAAHTRVHLHVLLQRALCLEALPTQQAEDSHVRACGDNRESSGADSLPIWPDVRTSAPSLKGKSEALRPHGVAGLCSNSRCQAPFPDGTTDLCETDRSESEDFDSARTNDSKDRNIVRTKLKPLLQKVVAIILILQMRTLRHKEI